MPQIFPRPTAISGHFLRTSGHAFPKLLKVIELLLRRQVIDGDGKASGGWFRGMAGAFAEAPADSVDEDRRSAESLKGPVEGTRASVKYVTGSVEGAPHSAERAVDSVG